MLCGRISPKMTMPMVEMTRAKSPEVMSPMRMEMAEFTMTLPRRRAQRRRLPFFLMGRIFAAYFFSDFEPEEWKLKSGRPDFMTSSNSWGVRDMRPRVRPEKRAERQSRKQMKPICSGKGRMYSFGGFSVVIHVATSVD